MALLPSDEILLPDNAEAARHPAHSRFAAFVPIGVALVGVAAILLGQVNAGHRPGLDPMATGSIHAVPASGLGDADHR